MTGMLRFGALGLMALGLAAGAAPWAGAAGAQTIQGLPQLLDRDHEIRLARSAAPASVSAEATVYVLRRGGYERAVEGSNGVSCFVDRSHVESLEPHCFDREGSETVLPRRLLRAELRERGMGAEEIDAEVARRVAAGEIRDPGRPAMSWMMSAGQVLYDGDRRVGAWRPHVMIYYPGLTPEGLGLPDPPSPPVMLFGAGEDMTSILVVVEDFVEVEGG